MGFKNIMKNNYNIEQKYGKNNKHLKIIKI